MFQFAQFSNNAQWVLQYDNTHKSNIGFPVRRDVSLRLFASVYIVSLRKTSSTYLVEVSLGRLFILCFLNLRFFLFFLHKSTAFGNWYALRSSLFFDRRLSI